MQELIKQKRQEAETLLDSAKDHLKMIEKLQELEKILIDISHVQHDLAKSLLTDIAYMELE